ncbi:RING finger protein [Aspergillus terreus]|uniref:RING finger protein n=1 Tax=Aspergillus terreus TaxID=33178 RepID=A0A5M3YV89_ASPTE|nr:hypothetical protein ATETN484_0004056700 [Aspergillus terreus]GFF13456.1 RING finger protein [Aspergillus terreus]
MAGSDSMDFDFRFPAPGLENNSMAIDDDNVNNATPPLLDDNPRQRSISPTPAKKKPKTVEQSNQFTGSPVPVASSTDTGTDTPTPPLTTTADLQAQVLGLFPDICADYVARLIEPLRNFMVQSHDQSLTWARFIIAKESIIEQILNQQSYPRQKRKRGSDTVEYRRNADRKKYLNRPKVEDKLYQDRILKILEQEFPLVPHNAIWSVIKDKKSLYLAYQELFTQEHSFEQAQRPYTRLEHTRVPSMDKEREVIQAYEYRYGADDTIEELNAAKEATRLEANAIRERVDKELAEKLNEQEHVQLGRLVECKCCYREVPSNRHVVCDGADAHVFCFTCIRKSAETQIGLMKYELRCMDVSDCDANFVHLELEMALGSALLGKLEALQQDDEIRRANLTGLESCPFCDFKAIYPPVEQNREFRCLNPSCEIVSCRLCNMESHLPQTCEEARQKVRGLEARHQVEEAMSKASIRVCPKCHVKIIRESGCNSMVCSKCGCNMCYLCRKEIHEEYHFGSPSGCQGGYVSPHEVTEAQETTIKKILNEDSTLKEEHLRVYPSDNGPNYNPPNYLLNGANRLIAPFPPALQRYPPYNVNTLSATQQPWAADGLRPTDPPLPPLATRALHPPATSQTTPRSVQTTPLYLNVAGSTPGGTAPGPTTTQPVVSLPVRPRPDLPLGNNNPYTAASQQMAGSNPTPAPDGLEGLALATATGALRGPESRTQTQTGSQQ